MRHITIDYGIDLGTTNSAICRMEHGEAIIIRSDSGMETMPSCVSFKKGGVVRIGQSAYADLGKDKLRALKRKSASASSSCIEFKRYMGTDTIFSNTFTEHSWSPEELSAQVIQTLCSFVTDDQIKAAVITVPAKFTVNQKDATLEAARLAGIEHVELLQEPIAASIAYGLKSEEKNGVWMVFDFGGGTLDVALVHVVDGVMQIFDTEGDNYLGGKNIDEAIVSKIILPQLTQKFVLNLSDDEQYTLLFEALKVEAERVKNKLSYSDSETIYLEAGDWGEDEDGEEIEIELTITRQDVEKAIEPILQKAVDVCKTLMIRNNITYNKLSHLILIGGPTHIPLLRKMLREQVTENVETRVNPMTAVATGAAIYASTIPVKIDKQNIDDNTLQLSVDFEATTVNPQQFIPVKATKATPGLKVKMIRRSDGWQSDNVSILESGSIIEVDLLKNQPNIFRLVATVNDVEVSCFPAELTIVHGTKAGTAILPYNIGIEVYNPRKERSVFTAFAGLEKNRPLPAVGNIYGLKTQANLRPGREDDIIRIAVYQGDDNAEGKSAVLFEYVSDVIISGEDIISYIPEGSQINIRIDVDRSEMMTITTEFPGSNQQIVKHLDTSRRQETKQTSYLSTQLAHTKAMLSNLSNQLEDLSEIKLLQQRLRNIEAELLSGAQHKQVEQHIKEVLRLIEEYEVTTEFEREHIRLKKALMELRIEANKKNDPSVNSVVENFEYQAELVAELKNVLRAKSLTEQIKHYTYSLQQEEIYRNFIYWTFAQFKHLKWSDANSAKDMINRGIAILQEDPNAPLSRIESIVNHINYLLVHDSDDDDNATTISRIDLPSM